MSVLCNFSSESWDSIKEDQSSYSTNQNSRSGYRNQILNIFPLFNRPEIYCVNLGRDFVIVSKVKIPSKYPWVKWLHIYLHLKDDIQKPLWVMLRLLQHHKIIQCKQTFTLHNTYWIFTHLRIGKFNYRLETQNFVVRNWIPSFSWLLFAAWAWQRNRASSLLQIFEDAKKMEKPSQPWSNDTITPWASMLPLWRFLALWTNNPTFITQGEKKEGCGSFPRLYFFHFPRCIIVEVMQIYVQFISYSRVSFYPSSIYFSTTSDYPIQVDLNSLKNH